MKFKVLKVELFKGFDVVKEFVVNNLSEFRGQRLTKKDWEDYDNEADSIDFDYDKVIIDEDDDCIVYFIKKLPKN